MEKKIRIHILPQIFYDDFLKKINVVWVSQYLFRNGYDFFLFLNSKFLYIKHQSFMFKNIEDKDLFNYSIIGNEKYNQTINIILELYNNNQNNVDTIFYFPTNKMFSLQIEIYCKYFNLFEYKLKNVTNFTFNEIFLNFHENIKKFEKEDLILEHIILKHLNDKIFAFFSSNTTVTHSIDLLYLMIDFQLKNLKSNYCIKIKDNETNQYLLGFKTFSLSEPKHFKNIYMYLNFEREGYFVNNASTYPTLNNKVIEYKNNTYFIKDNLSQIEVIEEANKSLEELFISLENYYFFDDIFYKLMQFYEIVVLNDSNEIIDYPKLNINFDIFSYLEGLILQKNDIYFLTNKLNNLETILKSSYKEQSKAITKCPYCFEGNIYRNENKFYCYNCKFFLSLDKIKEKYGINLTKRHLKILLRNKYIILPYNGENRVFFIFQSEKDFYWLTLLRKWK